MRTRHPAARLQALRTGVATLGWELPLFAFAAAVDQGGRLLLNLVAAAVLGPALFGTWVILTLCLQYGAQFAGGIPQGASREVPRLLGAGMEARANDVEDAALAGTVASSVLTALAILLVGGSILPDGWGTGYGEIALFAAALGLQQLFLLQQTLHRSRLRFQAASLQLAVQGVATAAIGVVLLAQGWGIGGLLWARVVVFLVALGLAARTLARIPRPRLSPLVLDLMRIGLPLVVAGFLFVAILTVDRWIVLLFLGRTAVGVYGVVGLVVSALILVPTVISQQYYPRLAFAHGEGQDGRALMAMAHQQGAIAAVLVAVGAFALAVCSAFAIPRLLPAYSEAIGPILIVLGGQVAFAAASGYGNLLIVLDAHRQYLATLGLVLVGNVVVSVGLVELGFGLSGVALASSAAMAVCAVLLYAAASRVTHRHDEELRAEPPGARPDRGLT